MFGTAIGVSTLTGRRPEIRRKLLAGAVGQVAVAGLLLTLGNDSAIWLLVLVALVAGVPQGLNTLANQNAVYHQADPARVGSSAGLMRTFFYLGAIVASTTNGIAFRTGATTSGLHDLALIMARRVAAAARDHRRRLLARGGPRRSRPRPRRAG